MPTTQAKKRLGRVAAQVVRRTPCRVLVARDWQPGPFRKIAVCIDGSDLGKKVLEQAIEVGLQNEAKLEAIHVIYPVDQDFRTYKIDYGSKSAAKYRAEAEANIKKRVESFTAPYKDKLDRLSYKFTTLESASPSKAITAHLQENEFDLAVLGTTGKQNWFGLRFGSNAERLIEDTHCSVLAIKPEAESKG